MSSSSIMILLLCAPIVGQITVILNATVGGSVMIPCLLPVNSTSIKWFYWQEDGTEKLLFHWHKSDKPQPVADEYKNRVQVFNTEFSSGNISIRLNNVSVGDDQKVFWAFVDFWVQQQCRSSLQVSAAYQDLNLTINRTLKNATCTAHGGYPEPQVKWTGQNKSSGKHLDLQDAQTSLQQHPTKKTFTVTSTISIKELQSVTCLVYNSRSKQSIEKNAAPGEDDHSTIGVIIGVIAAILLLLSVVYFVYRKYQESNWRCQPGENEEDSAATASAEGNAPGASSNSSEDQELKQRPQSGENEEDSAANAPADVNSTDAPSNSLEGDVSEDKVLLHNQDGSCLSSASNEDTTAAAAADDTEENRKILSDSKDDSD